MDNKAIDIVLLPDNITKQRIIAFHQKLDNGNKKQKIDITNNCLPHISLAMGGLIEEDAQELFKITDQIAKEIKSITLDFTYVSQHQNSKGEQISSLEHHQNAALYVLHEKLIYKTRKLLANKVNHKSFSGEESINKDSIHWVNDYFTNHSLNNFVPHITLGIGIFTSDFKSFSTTFKRLAICHLGNYCTCREILFETQLSD